MDVPIGQMIDDSIVRRAVDPQWRADCDRQALEVIDRQQAMIQSLQEQRDTLRTQHRLSSECADHLTAAALRPFDAAPGDTVSKALDLSAQLSALSKSARELQRQNAVNACLQFAKDERTRGHEMSAGVARKLADIIEALPVE